MVNEITAASDQKIGQREHLEDYATDARVTTRSGIEIQLGVVCDGVGGSDVGERAAYLTAQTIIASIQQSTHRNIPAILYDALIAANTAVYDELRGAGNSTVALMAVDLTDNPPYGRLYIAHAGDSHIYLVRDEIMGRLNSDHNRATDRWLSGQVSADEMRFVERGHHLTRAIGVGPQLNVDIGIYSERGKTRVTRQRAEELGKVGIKLKPTDTIFASSDGLFELNPEDGRPYLHEEEILKYAVAENVNEAVGSLIGTGSMRGPQDNISLSMIFIPGDREVVAGPVSSLDRRQIAGIVAAFLVLLVVGFGAFSFLSSERGAVEQELVAQQSTAQAAAVIATSDRATTIARLSATPTPTSTPTATSTPTPLPTPTVRPARASANEVALQYNTLRQVIAAVEEETSVTTRDGVNYLIIDGRAETEADSVTEAGANSEAQPAALFMIPGSEVLLDRVDNSREEIEMELMNNSDIFMQGGRYVVGGVTVALAENRNVSFTARSTCYSLRYIAQNQVAFTCYGVQNPDECQLDLPGQGERLVPENQEIVINSQTEQVVSEGIEPDYATMVRYYQVARSTIGLDSPAAQCVQPFVDRDADDVFNPEDTCPDEFGLVEDDGCPDSDGDGTHDGIDDCPEIPGPASNSGCPIPDTDGDGFNDFIDECRTTFGTLNGCPDRDGDGIRDSEDTCPNEPGLAEYEGCNLPESP